MTTQIANRSNTELETLRRQTRAEYGVFRARGLKLDMTRGKPAPEQLDLAEAMLALPGNRNHLTESGEDARNYGVLQGLPEARALFASLLRAPPSQIVVAGNSSLAVMHDCIVWALLKGVLGTAEPWLNPAFICPVPGYDRHFALCEEYCIRMLPVPMTGHGPDMDAVEALAEDPSVKGMWCVPKYSNPSGEVYSPETVRRLAAMRTGASNFRLFWDNAYAVHHLTERRHEITDILDACAKAGNPERTGKIRTTAISVLPRPFHRWRTSPSHQRGLHCAFCSPRSKTGAHEDSATRTVEAFGPSASVTTYVSRQQRGLKIITRRKSTPSMTPF
jgi:DNA-binding transcriptional MocR family regulator